MAKKYKCPYCEYRNIRKKLVEHISRDHDELIPEGGCPNQVVYDLVNNTHGHGKCRVCGKDTNWNIKAGRYDVLCGDPKCKEHMREQYKKNMLKVHGTYNILTSDEQQKKMLANRSISGNYKFVDGGVLTYTGSYERKCLEFMDKVMDISSKDILSPGPTLEYEMDGKPHFYITDFYYIPYNLIIEVKDGGSNPNNKKSTGMQSSRDRTIAKEQLITSQGKYNYIRLTDNNFAQLIEVFMDIKESIINGEPDKKHININEVAEMDNLKVPEFKHIDVGYHIEIDREGFNPYGLTNKWEVSEYYEDLQTAVNNFSLSNPGSNIQAHVFGTTSDLRPDYLGMITVYTERLNSYEWIFRTDEAKLYDDIQINHPEVIDDGIDSFYD